MKRMALWVIGILVFCGSVQPTAASEEDAVSLFNGKDISCWVNVNCAPNTFTVRDGMIHSTGKPTGVMRTVKQYENFVLELEYRHMKPGGNAGLFVWADPVTSPGVPFTRAIEVQILDGQNTASYTSHGDLFSIHGAVMTPDRPHPGGWARCLPSEHRAKPAGQWNHYRVVCNDGSIKLAVNGKVVSGGSHCSPRKGYICLESEGGEVYYRNLTIRELPSTHPKKDEIADVDIGFKSLYTGIDFAGWQWKPSFEANWRIDDWILKYQGKKNPDQSLWTEKKYTNLVFICDWKCSKKDEAKTTERSGIYLRGSETVFIALGDKVQSGSICNDQGEVLSKATLSASHPKGRWNRFVITLKGNHVTVVLNGKTVVENATLAGFPLAGPVGVRGGQSPLQFANLYIRELPQSE